MRKRNNVIGVHIVMGIPDVHINIKVIKTYLNTKKNISVTQYNIATIRLFGFTINYGLYCIGGSRGACPVHAPYGTQFFHFCIYFHQKVPTSEVHAPPNGCTPLYRKSWIRHCIGTHLIKRKLYHKVGM